jgi:hypothetical protein
MTAKQVSDLTEFSLVAVERFGGDVGSIAATVTVAMENLTTQTARNVYKMTGVEIDSLQVYNEAVQLGLDNGAKTYQQLDAQAKQQAYLVLLQQQLAGLQQDEVTYADNAAGKVKDLGAAWTNLWTGWGLAITNIMPKLTLMFDLMIYGLATWSGTISAIIDLMNGKINVSGFMQDAINKIEEVYKLYTNPPPSSVKGAPTGPSGTPLGTPAAPDALTATDQAKIEKDAEKQIIDLHDSEAAALEKIQVDLGNKLIDLKTKNVRNLAAIDVDAQNKAISIAQDTAETLLVDAEKKRLDDIEAQQKYYEELTNLRNTFELNLEDALRSRDAKTIIHLIEQYDLSKQQKAQQYADETVIRNENYQQEIDLANQQEQYKLEQLKQEVAQRKAALAIQYQQEIADAKTNADRQTTAEQVDISNRIKAWEDGLMLQYTITDTQMKSIYDNINAYLGKNGYVDSVYTYIIARMMQVYAAMSSLGGATTTPADTPLGYGHGNGMAKGGSLFANTPTSVTFGEAGPELAMFMPLGSGFAGSPSASFAGGSGGNIQLQVTLDDNLQAQIVNTTLNNVALSIDRMQRS